MEIKDYVKRVNVAYSFVYGKYRIKVTAHDGRETALTTTGNMTIKEIIDKLVAGLKK